MRQSSKIACPISVTWVVLYTHRYTSYSYLNNLYNYYFTVQWTSLAPQKQWCDRNSCTNVIYFFDIYETVVEANKTLLLLLCIDDLSERNRAKNSRGKNGFIHSFGVYYLCMGCCYYSLQENASLLSVQPYSLVMSWLQCSISFSLQQSEHLTWTEVKYFLHIIVQIS